MLDAYDTYFLGACDGNANAFVDEILNNARADIPAEIRIPDQSSGKVSTWDTKVTGVQNLNRGGNSCFDTIPGGAKAQLVVEARNLRADTRFRVRILKWPKVTKSGKAWAKIDYIRLRVGVQADITNRKLTLTDYAVETVNGYNMGYDLGRFLNLFKPLINRYLDKDKLLEKGTSQLRSSLVKALNNFKAWDKIPAPMV